jgi:hypothetical protein
MTFIPLSEEEGIQLDTATAAMDKLMALRQKRPRAAQLRTAIPPHNYVPPDPYAPALVKLREEQGLPPAAPCPFNSPRYDPYGPAPSPYAAGIEKMRKEKR